MTDTVTPVQLDVYKVLQAFIMDVTGLAKPLVIQGLPNRAAMPAAQPGFVVMTLIHRARLRTNVDTWDESNPAPTTIEHEQGVQLRMQLDLYGSSSGEWADMLSTLLRDDVGCAALAPACQPLYSEDPRLAPLIDTEEQYEARWILEAVLQYNPVTSTPMQFADAASVGLINVDEAYPP